jgi:hypothetical protein
VLSFTLLAGENTIIGGFALKTLKKLKGAKFGFPSVSTVLAKAIGLGAILPKRYPCNFATEISFGFIDNIVIILISKIVKKRINK